MTTQGQASKLQVVTPRESCRRADSLARQVRARELLSCGLLTGRPRSSTFRVCLEHSLRGLLFDNCRTRESEECGPVGSGRRSDACREGCDSERDPDDLVVRLLS